MMSPLIILLIISFLVNSDEAARILAVFPMPAISHQFAFRPITQELARRGHNVTVITPNPAYPKNEAPNNLREIDVHYTTYAAWRELVSEIHTKENDDVFIQMKLTLEFILMYVKRQFLDPEVQQLINNKNETFDLILMEHCTKVALIYSHLYQVPVIEISSFGAIHGHEFSVLGAPSHPILYPTWLQQKLLNLTTWEETNMLNNYYDFMELLNEHEIKENDMIKKLIGEDAPRISEMKKSVGMMFLNVHPVWEDNRPVPSNVIYLGGVHQNPGRKLPEDMESYLNSSRHGIIYFSLGTTVQPSLLPPDKIQMMLQVFSELPYDILWKHDKENLPKKPSNVRLEKWVPQTDLLRHPKVKLFITQGGLQSTDEAITAGVPLVTIPMLGDQWHNAERHVYHKIGVKLDLNMMTDEMFKKAINTVIEDESYRRNIEKLRDLMNDEPQRPVERAVWWIEHVMRHRGAVHLRSPAADMPWTQYYEIQLVLFVFLSLISIISFIVYTIYELWRYMGDNYLKKFKSY